jgi:hypothetical protein
MEIGFCCYVDLTIELIFVLIFLFDYFDCCCVREIVIVLGLKREKCFDTQKILERNFINLFIFLK